MKLHITKLMKLICILICLVSVLSNITTVMAYTVPFDGDSSKIAVTVPKVQKIVGTVLDVVRIIGAAVALIILMWIGAKFMMAAPSERANIKQYSMNYITGAIILMGASAILGIVKDVAQRVITP